MCIYAKPKKYIMYKFGFGIKNSGKCYIHCFPQQRYMFSVDEENGTVLLSNEKRHIDMCIQLEDFERNWKVVE